MTDPNEPISYGEFYTGLTKREYFAAMAMQGFISNEMPQGVGDFEVLADASIRCANKLIEALNK